MTIKNFTQKALVISMSLATGFSASSSFAQTKSVVKVSPSLVSTITKNPVVSLSRIESIKVPQVTTFENSKVKVINGKKFTFVKGIDAKGNDYQRILNADGKEITERDVPRAETHVFNPEVIQWAKKLVSQGDILSTQKIDIALDIFVAEATTNEVGSGEIIRGEMSFSEVNGQQLTLKELDNFSEKSVEVIRRNQNSQNKKRQELLMVWTQNYGLIKAEGVEESIARAGEGLTAELTAEQVLRLYKAGDKTIVGVEFTPEPKDVVANAMLDTNITNWALPFGNKRGDGIGIYMTESGCANESRLENYDRLAGSETNHSRNVGGILRAVSPNAFIYCRGSAVLPKNSDLDGVGGNDRIYIMTRSNGSAASSAYTTLDRDWDNFAYSNNLVSYVAAGNEGSGSANTIAPAKGLNTIAVGNYVGASDNINSGSSFLDPSNTGNDKPEISAPGTNISAGGFTMTGTSMACPHAAAFTADMMSSSSYLKYRPYLAKAKIMAGSTDAIGGGFDKVGVGGIDFLSAQYSGYWSWWSGGNNSWNYFDGLDGSKDGYVTRKVYISSSWDKVRVALAWMNRGTYTYNHRNDAHAIGMDLDLSVYGPNGNFVGSAMSWDNAFEHVNFTPSQSGYYTFKVKRFANRDNNSALRMGMYVNYYN